MGAGWNARRVYELAIGKYLKWAAVDDLVEPDLLRRCVEVLESDSGCVVAYASTKEVDENGTFIKNYVTPMKADSADPVARFREMLLISSWCYVGSAADFATGYVCQWRRSLLARLSLIGRFYEIPEHLFISRHHSAQSIRTLPVRLKQSRRLRLTNRYSVLPPPEWWDPAETRTLTFSGISPLARIFSVDLSLTSGGWTEASLLIPIRLKQVARLLREGGGHGRRRPAWHQL